MFVEIDYTNFKGERSIRRIEPIGLIFESNEWHLEKQWLLNAKDLDKSTSTEHVYRMFAMKDIHSWKPIEEKNA